MEGKARLVTVTPVLGTSVYATGDQIGTAFKLPFAVDQSSDTGAIMSLTVIDRAKQNQPLDILLFNSEPTLISADNAALNISDAEMALKCIGRLQVLAADYTDLANVSVACVPGIGLFIQASGGKDLWAVIQSRGTPTYAADGLTLKIGVVQD